jgi:hypothetical protein
MNAKRISKSPGKASEAAHALPALRRAAANARKLAIATGTPFYVWKDGRVVNLNPKGRLKRQPRPTL